MACVDSEELEKYRLERKRERNRIAATKCRSLASVDCEDQSEFVFQTAEVGADRAAGLGGGAAQGGAGGAGGGAGGVEAGGGRAEEPDTATPGHRLSGASPPLMHHFYQGGNHVKNDDE